MSEKTERLYDQAYNYIIIHCMEANLDRIRIAAALNCSTRSLSRAFERRAITLQGAIRIVRLHKGRELLRKKPKLTRKPH